MILLFSQTLDLWNEIKKFIWENKETSDATLRTVIKRVKDKIANNDFIVSKKGLGYLIESGN